jgi:hypothetical protein
MEGVKFVMVGTKIASRVHTGGIISLSNCFSLICAVHSLFMFAFT